jgi:hypothetical protein
MMNFHDLDYRSLFILGVIFFPVGLTTGLIPLWAFGVALVLIALANRDKWKKKA